MTTSSIHKAQDLSVSKPSPVLRHIVIWLIPWMSQFWNIYIAKDGARQAVCLPQAMRQRVLWRMLRVRPDIRRYSTVACHQTTRQQSEVSLLPFLRINTTSSSLLCTTLTNLYSNLENLSSFNVPQDLVCLK